MDNHCDITTRADIQQLIERFYEQVKLDPQIGFIFNEVVNMNWPEHIPVIVDFWETILLDNPVYTKNAMEVHYILNRKQPLRQAHFDAWLQLFTSTVDEMFTGKTATLAKARARSIAGLMLHKMNAENTAQDH